MGFHLADSVEIFRIQCLHACSKKVKGIMNTFNSQNETVVMFWLLWKMKDSL